AWRVRRARGWALVPIRLEGNVEGSPPSGKRASKANIVHAGLDASGSRTRKEDSQMTTSSRTKATLGAALLLAAAALAPRQSSAVTDIETFDRQAARSAAEDQVARPKAMCVCLSGDLAGVAGTLLHSSFGVLPAGQLGDIEVRVVSIRCVALGFDIAT